VQQGKEAVGYVHHESGRPETTDEASYKEAGRAVRAPRHSAILDTTGLHKLPGRRYLFVHL
ncbi:hypothetical protein PISMIDRAFT_679211, partial [Pisolithus microcarpus 441]